MEKFFKSMFNKPKRKAKINKVKYVDKLYEIPKKDKGLNQAKFMPMNPDLSHQADLLFLPNDNGYKYALTVVDVGSRLTDAEPIKDKTAKTIINAFKSIYSRDYLNFPKVIQTDSGTEFKGDLKKFFEDKKINMRYAKPYRHRQQGLIEARNKTIGKALFKLMTAREALTGEESKDWIEELPVLIKQLNEAIEKKPIKRPPENILCEGDACKLYTIGTKVRVALDAPLNNITGKRLTGEFRASDIRYDTTVRTIEDIILTTGSVPLYRVSGMDEVAYTKNQLQKVDDNEEAPDKDLLKGQAKTYIVEKIVDKKKEKGKTYYRVKWFGFPTSSNTWQTAQMLREDVPDMVEEYEKSSQKTPS